MTIYRNMNGSWVVSSIVGGYRVARTYYGYTKREAARLFKAEVLGCIALGRGTGLVHGQEGLTASRDAIEAFEAACCWIAALFSAGDNVTFFPASTKCPIKPFTST